MISRAQLRRVLGLDEAHGENVLNRAWDVKTYIHVGASKYEVCYIENRFVAFLPGFMVTGETMEKTRDGAIEALERTRMGAR
jgi:hypothetical protein